MREILHCDLNNFYASVACHDNPELQGKAVAVGGSVEERHGIILAKNEIAKKFGVITGEAIWKAEQKCSGLIIVPPDFKRYIYFSTKVRSIYEEYTDLVEPFGIDECWLDVTGSKRLFGSGKEIADKIRREVKEKCGLTVSVGVSFNKIFAKLGSDLKKPDATTVISYEDFKEKIWNLDADKMLGVGSSTKKKLCSLGIFTIGDLAEANIDALKFKLGKNGEKLSAFAKGEENSPVMKSDFKYRPESIGRSVTSPKDIVNFDYAYKVLLRLSEEVARELRKNDMEAHSIQVDIRYNNLTSFCFTESLEYPLQSSKMLADEGIKVLKKHFDFEMPLRSIGIRVLNLEDYAPQFQLSFFDNRLKIIKQDNLEKSIDKIRARYGDTSVMRASLMGDFKAFKQQSPSTLGHSRLSTR